MAIGGFAMRWYLGEGAELDHCHGLPHRPGEMSDNPSEYISRCPKDTIIIPIHHPAGGFYKTRAKGMIRWDYEQVAKAIKRIREGKKIHIPSDPICWQRRVH